ncbi:GIY-YIG nuclease superfamily protein [Candidatus Roizmanbacteria bacterium CG09_land_8_20_14_0_10_41_9]|uniref:GIY-YIG nuclease superfamily protein n=1 Tax=Candidatus Roizmanbacteria bacterium CG09_land_8_20_14_0_10_41_9 TaxID=1974850 RepID=A0A2H0WST2_9BACT|nr:MAG: GIY-YIG nuclease superfamily protein [Candidatus Roizmanbacteria bacterium CG09_land_8_20_14_0_10_41_9]
MYYVYILESLRNGKYYVGCTDNIQRRLKEHNSGKNKYTKTGLPWELIYKECYNNLSIARKRERQIKGWKKRKAIEALLLGYRSHRLVA